MENYGYLSALKKYATFSGRAPRKEYWMFALVYLIAVLVLSTVDGALFGYTTEPSAQGFGGKVSVSNPIFSSIFMLSHLIPGLAVTIRRLHDTGKSGWWILISLIPFIGTLILLYFMIKGSEPEENRFGTHPYGMVDAEVFGRA